MEVIEFGRLTDAFRHQLEGDERDPFGSSGNPLTYRPKDRHVALRDDAGHQPERHHADLHRNAPPHPRQHGDLMRAQIIVRVAHRADRRHEPLALGLQQMRQRDLRVRRELERVVVEGLHHGVARAARQPLGLHAGTEQLHHVLDHEPHDLADLLGDLAGVSPGHLCRTMREYYAMTPTEFVTALRLRHAEVLLATTSEPLTSIAYRCGFSSPSYFSKCFHATQGVSPRDFRRRARQAVLP